MTAAATGTNSASNSNSERLFPQELNILYDSKCNVCKLEIDFLRRRDERLNGSTEGTATTRLKFTDLESDSYNDRDPANGGIDYETGMKAMHAVTPDGKVVQGVPVFKLAYEQVKLGWLFRVAEIPVLSWLFDRAYDIFAAYRTILTRGTTVPTLVEAYREKQQLLKEQQATEECETCSKEDTIDAKPQS
eukprot:CAMPEP_0119004326 /NCGR_PEP_ID=MMETSP1176-20130426/1080_1 /TAXON_ID=265551 /ORGANISM="Synedropsis recta cf, Strain CCMP1620" /LENGTH=189 /DNA_ID=CAMNT_0006956017 /DNA_START=155 /DNA_END=724 /DNA_ORIENTATION=+